MIVYNTTFHIDEDVLDEGLAYLKEFYIPRAVAGGFLLRPCLRRVVGEAKGEGQSFAVQFHVKNIDTLHYWLEQEGSALHQALVDNFGQKVTGFTTLLEEIEWE